LSPRGKSLFEGKVIPLRAVIFDFGGVLLRTFDYAGRRKWEARLGLTQGGLEQIVFDSDVATQAMLGDVPESAVWDNAASQLGIELEDLEQLKVDFWAGDLLDEELVRFLSGLRPQCRTAILSNAWSGARDVFSGRLGLDRAVDTMIISAEERLAKPDGRIYYLAAERLGIRPAEAVFVDDLQVNIDGARAVGMQGIRFQSREQVIADVLQSLNHHA
jgi:epoxide hydrolase-like predicted phosphatase